jgi:predicted MFS family arabinose efflux permease
MTADAITHSGRFSSLTRTFSALHSPNYRLWFAGQLLSLIGTWTQTSAQGYLVYELTGSPAFLGIVSFAAGAPSWLFTLYAGAIADRLPRRSLLIGLQAMLMVLAVATAALVFTGAIQAWHIVVLAVLVGIANAFEAPVRHSFVAELVDRKDLTNAIALNATVFNSAVVIGPSIGGVIYALFGPGWCFTINAISFLAVIGALVLMRLAPMPDHVSHRSVMSEVGDGLRYVARSRTLITLMVGAAFASLFGFGVMPLIPAWAVDVLGGDVKTNGLLLSARGFGSVTAALLVAALSHRALKGRMWINGAFIAPLALIAFSFFRAVPLAMIGMLVIGFGQMIFLNTTNALVQGMVTDDMRGRVMGLYSLVMFGSMPLGSLLAGSLAEWIGTPAAVLSLALVLLGFALAVRRVAPTMKQLE